MKEKKFVKAIVFIVNMLIFGIFGYWYFANDSTLLFSSAFSAFNVVVLCSIINRLAPSLEEIWHVNQEGEPERYFYPETPEKIYYIQIIIGSLIFFAFITIMFLIFLKSSYPALGFNQSLERHFSILPEVEKYIFLSKNWYTAATGDFNNYKDIFPLYLILIYPFVNTSFVYIAQILLNIVLSVLSCIFLFNIALFDYDEDTAFKAVIFLLLLPVSFFLIMPLPTALLLFLSLLYIFFVRRREWAYSAIAGYFVGLTHPLALVLMFFGLIEYIAYAREDLYDVMMESSVNLDKSPLFYISDKDNYKFFIPYVLKSFSVFSIFIAYLFFIYLNKDIYVNEANIFLFFKEMFKFKGPYFFSNAFFIIKDFQDGIKELPAIAMSKYLPVILFMSTFLLIIFKNYNKMRASFLVYLIAVYMTIFGGDTMQTKYAPIMFPIAFIFALLSEKKIYFIICTFVSAISLLTYYAFFIFGYPVV